MGIQRWKHPEGSLGLDPAGSVVLFADVEDALKDKAMLDWLLPVISGEEGMDVDHRTHTLALGIALNRSGRDLVAWAMQVHSSTEGV